MEPALDVMNSALQGDTGARSFLERTTSIYVMDVTDVSKPKTYGCWNFIHQAMNEIERQESKYYRANDSLHNSPSSLSHGHVGSNGSNDLVGHARLLASMALRVARRSPAADRALVTTCIDNASHYSATESQSEWLVDLNLELREIVMGRIAAMAFDFSFHRKTGPHGQSAFADRVVMDTFCAILSANAVASGPGAIRHFATEWIIPSSRNLPAFAVASVVSHLGSEAVRKSAPAGTKDILQKLSVSAMNEILVPTLAEAVSDNSSNENNPVSAHVESSQIAAVCLRAMKTWCDATDLSLPQIKHICSKIGANIVSILSDAMYSDSHEVIDALAELIEATVIITDDKVMSKGRMEQVRHILQVDETSFRAQFSAQQLKTIESFEMSSIVDELVSAIGLQRFRFTERQNKGDFDVCRNLTRIAALLCSTWLDVVHVVDATRQPESGAISLLAQAAGHQSVNLCAIALPVLTRMMPRLSYLPQDLLPILQRRAIIPHHVNNGIIVLDASDVSGVTFPEFQSFRQSILAEALVACWNGCSDHFMDSCTSAVEEFCTSSSTINFSLQLEAALFCIEKVAHEALDPRHAFQHHEQMKRLFSSLPAKPISLMVNPLTRERLCCFLRKYTTWSVENGFSDTAFDLAISCFQAGISPESRRGAATVDGVPQWTVSEACLALAELLTTAPYYFKGETFLPALSGIWESCYADAEHLVKLNDRIVLANGICQVIAFVPDIKPFESMAMLSLGRLERITAKAQEEQQSLETSPIFSFIADEIEVLVSISRSYTDASFNQRDEMESGCEASSNSPVQTPDAVLQLIHRAWPRISYAGANWADHERVAGALSRLLSELLPSTKPGGSSVKLLPELCTLSSSFLNNRIHKARTEVVFSFLNSFVDTHGAAIETATISATLGVAVHDYEREISRLFEKLVLDTVSFVEESLGNAWSDESEQGNGQVAFESKLTPQKKVLDKSNESLASMLSFLCKSMEICPLYILQLPASHGEDRDEDKLIRRAVDSSVASLNDSDPEVTRNALKFLKIIAKHSGSPHDHLRAFATETLSRIRGNTIGSLLYGSCGKYEYKVLGDVAELLSLLLRTCPLSENEPHVVASLRSENFKLGDQARNLALVILARTAQENIPTIPTAVADLTVFLQDVWSLHQIEDTDSLPTSDVVSRFLQKFS